MGPDVDRVTPDSSGERTCPACGSRYPAATRFCPSDGQALREEGLADDALVGTLVADRYYIERQLGVGGMGVVYLAQHVFMSRRCALKVLRPEYLGSADALGRFTRGAQNASRIGHPNVAAIYDFGEVADESMYLAMEYVDGVTLGDLLESNGPLTIARCVTIVSQVASALKAAHDMGVVHRDLKPDNIMLARSGETDDLVKVVDFGIARSMFEDSQRVTQSDAVIGTPAYMSPEQLSGRAVDARSDLYSLALVTYAMLAGRLPLSTDRVDLALRFLQRPKSLRELRGDISWPRELQEVLDAALAADPDDRYENVSQFARALIGALRAWRPDAVADAVANLTRLGVDVSLALSPDTIARIATPVAQPALPAEPRRAQRSPALIIVPALIGAVGLSVFVAKQWKSVDRGVPATAVTRPYPMDSSKKTAQRRSSSIVPPDSAATRLADQKPTVGVVDQPSRQAATMDAKPAESSPPKPRAGARAQSPVAGAQGVATLGHDSVPAALPEAPIVPTTGILRIGTLGRVGAALYINDRLVGVVSALRALPVAPGAVRIRLQIERCQDWDSTVTVTAGDTTTVGYRRPTCPP